MDRLFTVFKKRELLSCINMTAAMMRSSLEDAKELVVHLLDEVNHNGSRVKQ